MRILEATGYVWRIKLISAHTSSLPRPRSGPGKSVRTYNKLRAVTRASSLGKEREETFSGSGVELATFRTAWVAIECYDDNISGRGTFQGYPHA